VGQLELPKKNAQINDSPILVKGWAFSKTDNELIIEIYVDGILRRSAKSGLPRFDIFQNHSTEQSYESGFLDRLELDENKSYNISIIALSGEIKKEIGNVTVTKKNSFKIKKEFFQPIPGSNRWSKKLNQKYIDFFVNHGNLKPNHRVLEVGSGIGRITMLLTKFLNEGEYHGLETVPRAVEYCKENISPRYPNFQFEIADVYNKAYNPEGKFKCSDYRFPYDDDTFDFVILSSVFTHLVLDDMKNYLHEISRVMKKGGYCYITYSLLNDNTLNRLKNKLTIRRYDYEFDGYRVRDKNMPENAIAYDESLVKELFDKNGLEIKSIHYGKWAGFKNNLTAQDIIIAMKN